MQYKGFNIKYFYDIRSGVFVGEVTNAQQMIVFSAATLSSLRQAMVDAVEDYLALNKLAVQEIELA